MGNIYIGDSNSKARKIKSLYVGVNGLARKIKAVYVGDANGKARLVWQSVIEKITKFISSLHKGYCTFTSGYINSSQHLNRYFNNVKKVGDNLYAAVYSDSCYTNGEYRASGIQFIKLDSNGTPTAQKDAYFYSLSGSNISPYGCGLSTYTSFGDGKIYALGYYYTSYAEYNETTYYKFMYDYHTGNWYRGNNGSENSSQTSTSYTGIAKAGNNGIIYMNDYYNKMNGTGSFVLNLDYNITIGNNTYTAESSQKSITSSISQYQKNSSMALYEIDDTSGLIVESQYSSGNYRFLKYTINTSSSVTGANRITLYELGTHTFANSYNNVIKVNNNTFLFSNYNGYFVALTINSNNTITYGTETYLADLANCIASKKIGNSSTFITYPESHDTTKLIYVDTNNRTVSYLGTQSVGTKDHTYSAGYNQCDSYGDDGVLYFSYTVDDNYGYVHVVIDTFK